MDEQTRLVEYLKRVTAELHTTRCRLQEVSARSREPIAVISTACRFPGGIRSPEALWDLVRSGRETVTEIPADRGWELPDGVVARGGFLDAHADFDAGFFGISPREALAMDPQQRLLLELSWELVERARIEPTSLRGTRTGVFAGVVNQEYASILEGVSREVEGYVLTGSTSSVVSGRVAYSLGLEGPALTIDTACSSSLVAIHLACRALRAGECDLALAGGVTVMSTPTSFIEFTKQGALSSDGRCRAFAAAAAGFGLSEGLGLVLLERLSDALARGHEVLAIVRGSSVNQDGASNGLTAPNGPSQQRVIRAALEDAQLSADRIDFVEAHGTGTTLGDPIEAQALLATYGQGRDRERPVLLGSIKSNVGHTQAAAGVAGVIKVIEALRHRELPGTLHVDAPSPHVDWASGAVQLLRETTPWPTGDEPRRAAISAFGISGTNAHLILEEAPASVVEPSAELGREAAPDVGTSAMTPVVLQVSAVDDATLRAQAGRLADHLASRSDLAPADVAYALAHTRMSARERLAVIGSRRAELVAALRAAMAGTPSRNVVRGVGPAREPGGVVFVFPGQGPQWVGMARELMDTSPVFRERLQACAEALTPHVEWPVLDVLRGAPGAPALDRPDVVQPALFAMMVALAQLWRAHGVEPSAVVGHSQGEIAAACVAGVLSLEDAALIVGRRSRALLEIAGRGGMVAVAAAEQDVAKRIEPWGRALAVAVVNSPRSVVVSGDGAALDELVAACEADNLRARRVAVDYASHSPHVEAVRERLGDVLAAVAARRGTVPICSTVTGQLEDGAGMDALYWYTNLRERVRFEAATRSLLEAGHRVFVEVSPHPVLTMAIDETAEAVGLSGVTALGTLRRDEGGVDRVQRALAEAYVRGLSIEWGAAAGASGSRRPVELPTTVFRAVRHWPALPSSQRPNEARTSRYRVAWKAFAGPAASRAASGATRLLLVPRAHAASHAEALTAALSQDGARVVTVVVDAQAVRDDQGASRVAELLRPLTAEGTIDVVVSLLGLDPTPLDAVPHVSFGVAASFALIQALGALDVRAPLWLLTRGAVAVEASEPPPEPSQAQIWGLGRVAALEHPERWGGLVDLPDRLDLPSSARLLTVLAGHTGEDQIALRAKGLFARRMERISERNPAARAEQPHATDDLESATAAALRKGTVLITGGLGALGAHVARHLARFRDAKLLLVGRNGAAAPGAREFAAELSAQGAQVELARCDVSDAEAVRELVASRARAGQPIRSVIHAAGVGSLVPLAKTSLTDLTAVLAAKATGADNLDRAFEDAPVDAFVVFSSGAGVWGGSGQGAYAAANAHLDALVARRRARGLPGTAVAWGLWAGEGMGAGSVGDVMRRRGMLAMSPASAVAHLMTAVRRDEGELIVADIDWPKFVDAFTAVRASRLFECVPEATPPSSQAPAAADLDPVIQQWRSATGAAERHDLLAGLVAGHAAAVLGLAHPKELDPDRAFREVGFDSLTAVELRHRLSGATGLTLPTTIVFDHPTPDALTKRIDALLGACSAAAEPSVSSVQHGAAAAVDEPIAIVSMGCRLPGAGDPDALWRLLADGVDAISDFPTDRGWDLDAIAHAAPERGPVSQGGFCYDAADFDAGFFGIAPREADLMDPQQRLVLETAWETIERAGIDPRSLRGSATAIMLGVVSQDYAERLALDSESTGYRITGGSAAVVSGRVAYVLGSEGPALTIDTACSSSLVAIHLACQALRRGEASMALAGGVTIMVNPTPFVEFSRQGGMSSDGRCRSFAASADGTGWGEGVGLILLERLSDAIRRGHQVLALVAGSAINQDGASNGLTAPNGLAQQRVIEQALAAAGASVGDVDAVEAHGTGTTLGDPIEASALLATYGQRPDRNQPLWLGTLKSNIGHTQAAAGVAGVIKMVLSLQREQLAPTLHIDTPSPHVDWSGGAVRLLTEPIAWPRGERPRRAGVSAFGISGTNAHLILQEAPEPRKSAPAAAQTALLQPLPFLLCGHGKDGLRAQAERLGDQLERDATLALPGLARSLVETRSRLGERSVLFASDRDELLAGLRSLAAGKRSSAAITGTATRRPKLAFLLPGQGSQQPGMGRSLYEANPSYARAFDEVCGHFDRTLAQPLADVVFSSAGSANASLLDRTEYTQPALFATQVALARLLGRYGIKPDILLGHSVGELVAVYLAGMLSLSDACTLVAARGRLMQACPSGGAMVAIEASPEELLPLPTREGAQLALAAVNGPNAVVVSGDEEPVLELAAAWARKGRRTKRLVASHAFHSAHMEGARTALEQVAAGLRWSSPTLPILSNLTGSRAADAALRSSEYWGRQMCETVRFADGVRSLDEASVTVCLELGVDGVLSSQVLSSGIQALAIPLLRPARPEPESLLMALASLHVHGIEPGWPTVLEDVGVGAAALIPLPTYAFQRRRHWLDVSRTSSAASAVRVSGPGTSHPILHDALDLADGSRIYGGRITRKLHPWLADHAVHGNAVVPGIALLDLVLVAAQSTRTPRVDELTFRAPILLPNDADVRLQLRIGPVEHAGRTVSVHSCVEPSPGTAQEPSWVLNALGRLTEGGSLDAQAVRFSIPAEAKPISAEALYDRLRERGYTFGPAFRSMRSAWLTATERYSEVRLPEPYASEANRFAVHPALLDSAGHVRLENFSDPAKSAGNEVPILFAVEGAELLRSGVGVLRSRVREVAADAVSIDLIDASGHAVGRIDKLVVRSIASERLRTAPDTVLRLAWAAPAPAIGMEAGRSAHTALLWSGRELHHADVPRDVAIYAELDALVAEVAAGARAHDHVVALLTSPPGPNERTAAAALGAATRALELVRSFLAANLPASTRLLIATVGAVATSRDEALRDPAAAAAWGLVRSAQSEHPGRFVLIDLEDLTLLPALLRGALLPSRLASGQLALRRQQGALVPTLVPVASAELPQVSPVDPERTVLITGASGGLGRTIARHLVTTRGARRLLLLSRRGFDAPAMADHVAELQSHGAHVESVACDVADRGALAAVVRALPPEHPIGMVVHAAGVLDDGLVVDLTPSRLAAVMRPKIDGAFHLDELTRGHAPSDFVLFSSASGTLGHPGQAAYAAANAALDALAAERRSQGLPIRCLAWGPWSDSAGMAGRLAPPEARRLQRLGVRALSVSEGLQLFDVAGSEESAVVLPIGVDKAALAAAVREGDSPTLLHGLVPAEAAAAAPRNSGALRRQLAALRAPDREQVVLAAIRAHVARQLGQGPETIAPDSPLLDLGFNSLMAIELRNELGTDLELRLSSTLIFEHPTPLALARHLCAATSTDVLAASHAADSAHEPPVESEPGTSTTCADVTFPSVPRELPLLSLEPL